LQREEESLCLSKGCEALLPPFSSQVKNALLLPPFSNQVKNALLLPPFPKGRAGEGLQQICQHSEYVFMIPRAAGGSGRSSALAVLPFRGAFLPGIDQAVDHEQNGADADGN